MSWIAANKIADPLEKKGSQIKFTGQEPDLGFTQSVVHSQINDWDRKITPIKLEPCSWTK